MPEISIRFVLKHDGFTLDVDTDVSLHGITGIYGESGAGKTSLLRCIAGLERAHEGRLLVDGDVWQDSGTGQFLPAHKREIAYVFQESRLFNHMDVQRNLDYGSKRARGNGRSAGFEPVVDLLGLRHLLHRMPGALSGGESQRVAIGRALLRNPRFVLMDEPLASLDKARRAEVLPFLDRLHSELSVPIVYVSHSIEEISRLCDQLMVMHQGRVVASGDLQSVLTRTDLPMIAGEEAGTVLHAAVTGYDADYDLTRVRFSGGELWVSGCVDAGCTDVRLRIRANDVSLCRERPAGTTILNVIPATIDDIQSDAGPAALVCLSLGTDTLLARVTRRSISDLGLAAGDRVLAQIKSVALRSVPGGGS